MSEWRWFGKPGHFICSSHCRFHLCTVVGDGKYFVSTVGEYVPDAPVREIIADSRGNPLVGRGDAREADWMKKFGFEEIGVDRKYETMVFKVLGGGCEAPGCNCGMPTVDWAGLDDGYGAYNEAGAADAGHLALCRQWDTLPGDGAKETPGE